MAKQLRLDIETFFIAGKLSKNFKMEEEGLSRIPNLQIARLKFLCTMPEYDSKEKHQAKEQLMTNIKEAS